MSEELTRTCSTCECKKAITDFYEVTKFDSMGINSFKYRERTCKKCKNDKRKQRNADKTKQLNTDVIVKPVKKEKDQEKHSVSYQYLPKTYNWKEQYNFFKK